MSNPYLTPYCATNLRSLVDFKISTVQLKSYARAFFTNSHMHFTQALAITHPTWVASPLHACRAVILRSGRHCRLIVRHPKQCITAPSSFLTSNTSPRAFSSEPPLQPVPPSFLSPPSSPAALCPSPYHDPDTLLMRKYAIKHEHTLVQLAAADLIVQSTKTGLSDFVRVPTRNRQMITR